MLGDLTLFINDILGFTGEWGAEWEIPFTFLLEIYNKGFKPDGPLGRGNARVLLVMSSSGWVFESSLDEFNLDNGNLGEDAALFAIEVRLMATILSSLSVSNCEVSLFSNLVEGNS